MILAAGRGERMRPLTDHTPKPLLEVGGKPLIVWHLERLAQAGFEDVVINHAHLGHLLERDLGNGAAWGVNIHWSPEPHALETAGGIARALPWLGASPFLVINGDVFCTWDLARAKQIQLRSGSLLAHLVMVPNPAHHPEGDFSLEGDQVQTRGPSSCTFSGLGVYHPALFSGLSPDQPARLAPVLQTAIEQGQVQGELFTGQWEDVGTPARLAALDRRLRGHSGLAG